MVQFTVVARRCRVFKVCIKSVNKGQLDEPKLRDETGRLDFLRATPLTGQCPVETHPSAVHALVLPDLVSH